MRTRVFHTALADECIDAVLAEHQVKETNRFEWTETDAGDMLRTVLVEGSQPVSEAVEAAWETAFAKQLEERDLSQPEPFRVLVAFYGDGKP